MADREKVIKGLECCSTYDDYSRKSCRKCPYNEPEGKRSCKLHQMRVDALTLLKAQAPRVMTLEELEDALDTVVWLDIPNTENLADGYSLIMAYSHKNGFIFLESPFGDNPSQDRFEYKDYGITWRCWTSRPTDEQREAVKWDEPPKEEQNAIN